MEMVKIKTNLNTIKMLKRTFVKQENMAIRNVNGGLKCDKNGLDTRVEVYFFDVKKWKHCPH